ncbi:MAG: ATP-binding cassette domain-containing protein [Gammaproteobacteria bacterium]|nr:ABC transporter ATP-binding protein [Gammaproteobacteria bacterium]NIP90689.1 ABC transporter ATP-binding protein [Gammaproteobacteria bacterium]NIR25312.1 ABC transporter ATP-binding protein [Gammaproteobacteria bacterium]NIS07008.1 ABC transporter ATP-binding protein [Gammaproteobacteria bacterium]NIU41977.1 ATP-binding cassette domain-containing protein [Gammaproteobacteria bacterium]
MPLSPPRAAAPSAIRIAKVAKRYSRLQVLDGLDLEVGRGEFFGLVGVNGVGKTTCIKGLLDFTNIDAGSVEIFGVPHRETRARRHLAFLPERFLPPYYLSGRDFLDYMGRLHGRPCGEDERLEMCARLDLDAAALAKPVRDYSKGMAQKLGLAACFLSGKELLVLDEPMSGLDPKARILVKRHLRSCRSRGHSVFISTHMLSDVEELCDRMGILHAGKLRFVGSPEECRRTYFCDTLEEAYLNCISQPAS